MQLAVLVEEFVLIFVGVPSDSESRSELRINRPSISQPVQHVSLCKGPTGVEIHVVFDFTLGGGSRVVLVEEPELADQLRVGQVDCALLASLPPVVTGAPWKDPGLDLVGEVVSARECKKLDRHLHPRLTEQHIVFCSRSLEGASLHASEGSDCSVQDHLLALHDVVLVDLLGIGSVIAILSLNVLDLDFSSL